MQARKCLACFLCLLCLLLSTVNSTVVPLQYSSSTLLEVVSEEYSTDRPATYYTSIKPSMIAKGLYDWEVTTDDETLYFSTLSEIYKLSNGKIVHIAGNNGFIEDGTALTSTFFITDFQVRKLSEKQVEIYILERNTIRKIWSNSSVTTICGSEIGSYSGDGGLASNGTLSNPSQILMRKGEIIILDSGNYRIRKISKDGYLSTIAGNGNSNFEIFEGSKPALEQAISPSAIQLSNDNGQLFITNHMAVLMLDLETGLISVIIEPTIRLYFKYVYITKLNGKFQYYANMEGKIVHFDTLLGNETVIAGKDEKLLENSTMDGSMANGVAISVSNFLARDKEGKIEFYFVDGSDLIRKVDFNGRIWTLFGARKGTIEYFSIPAKYALIKSPTDVYVDRNGDVYFNDVDLSTYLRKMKPDGSMSALLTPLINTNKCNNEMLSYYSLSAGFLSNIAISNNSIYTLFRNVDDFDILIKVDSSQYCTIYGRRKESELLETPNVILNDPRGLFVQYGQLYFADSGSNRVFKIENSTLVLVAGNRSMTGGFAGDGGLATEALLNRPTSLFVTDQNEIYIADSGNNRIRKISNGIISTVAGGGNKTDDNVFARNSKLNGPKGVFYNSNNGGELFIADTNNHKIRKVDRYGFINTIVGSGIAGKSCKDNRDLLNCELNAPSFVQMDSYSLYFLDTNNHAIRSVSYGHLETVLGQLGNPSILYYPEAFHIYSYGYMLIADTANNRLANLKFSKLDIIMENIVRPTSVFSTSNHLFEYYFTSNDKIFLSERNVVKLIAGGVGDNNRVEYSKLSLGGIHATDEYIYVADSLNNRIRRISIESGIISTIVGSGDYGYSGDNGLAVNAKLSNPQCVFVTDTGDIYLCDGSHRIRKVSATTGIISTVAGIGVKGNSIENILAVHSKIDSPSKIYVSSTSDVFFIQQYFDWFYTPILSKISKDGIISTIYNGDVIGLHGYPNSPDLVISTSKMIIKLSATCPDLYTLSKDNTSCIPLCDGISSDSKYVCSSLGTCDSPNSCSCNNGYNGTNCELAVCSQGCMFGTCISPNICRCNNGYYGGDCSSQNTVWIVSISVVIGIFSILLVSLIIISVSYVLYKRYRRKKITLYADINLTNSLLTGFETEMAHSSRSNLLSSTIQHTTFFIPLEQLNLDRPIKRLGSGAFGSVLSCSWNSTIVAVKIFDLNNINISEEDFMMEAAVLSKLRHPNIINFYGISTSETKRYIIMECLDQSMEKIIADLQNEKLKLSLKEKLCMLQDIAEGIHYLHSLDNKIIHRDLKPGNVLVNKDGICKLCDFGLSRALSKNTFSAITSNLGTMQYMAPETQYNDNIDRSEATAIDVFSFAIIFYQLLFELKDPYIYNTSKTMEKLGLQTPITFNNLYHLNRQICDHEHRPSIPFSDLDSCKEWCHQYLPSEPNHYEVLFQLCELNKKCWAGIPNNRPSVEEIIEKISSLKNQL